MLSRFHLIPGRYGRTDRQTDERTDLLYQYRASECWRAIKTRNEVGTKAPAHFSSLCREFTANNIVHWLHVQCSAVFSRTSSHTQLGVHHVGLRRHRRATTVWNVDGISDIILLRHAALHSNVIIRRNSPQSRQCSKGVTENYRKITQTGTGTPPYGVFIAIQLNSTELNWPSWTAYSQVSRVFVYDVMTYKLSQLGH